MLKALLSSSSGIGIRGFQSSIHSGIISSNTRRIILRSSSGRNNNSSSNNNMMMIFKQSFSTASTLLLLTTSSTSIITNFQVVSSFPVVGGWISIPHSSSPPSLSLSSKHGYYDNYRTHTTTTLASSSINGGGGDNNADNEEEAEASPEDLNRWDQMYQEGEARRNRLNAMMNPESFIAGESASAAGVVDVSAATLSSSPIRVITFDLDNTLWNTGATIGTANNVLADFLNSNNIVQTKRTEDIMKELFLASKATYCPLLIPGDEENTAKSPVLLTQLRKDALQQILIEDNGYTEDDAKKFADEAFDKWMTGRYESIPNNYATNVLEVFDQIISSTSSTKPVLIGAITDGNSDPRNIPQLSQYFDFCINAEQVGVSKPDQRVYIKAMEYVRNYFRENNNNNNNDLLVEGDEEVTAAGPWWVHIGDDFSKDIVAAKNLNMRTIWSRELILDKLKKKEEDEKTTKETISAQYGKDDEEGQERSNKLPSAEKQEKEKATAMISPEKELMEFQQRINSKTIVKMAVGAEDYLMAGIQQEFADAIIDNFADLPKILQQWSQQSQQQQQQPLTTQQQQQDGGGGGGVYVPDEADLVRDMLNNKKNNNMNNDDNRPSSPPPPPDAGPATTTTTTTRGDDHEHEQQERLPYVPEEADLVKDLVSKSKSKTDDDTATKFCVFCGTKLPAVAIHCSSCGQKQPQI